MSRRRRWNCSARYAPLWHSCVATTGSREDRARPNSSCAALRESSGSSCGMSSRCRSLRNSASMTIATSTPLAALEPSCLTVNAGTSSTRCASLPRSLPSSSRVSLTRRSWGSAVVLAERAFVARGLASPGPFLGAISVLLRAPCLWLWSVSGFFSEEYRIWSCLGDGFRFVSVFWACSVRRRYMFLRGNLVISYEYLALLFVVVVSPEVQNFAVTGR